MAKLAQTNPLHRLEREGLAIVLIIVVHVYFLLSAQDKDTEWLLLTSVILVWFLAKCSKLLHVWVQQRRTTLVLNNYLFTYLIIIALIGLYYTIMRMTLPSDGKVLVFLLGFPLLMSISIVKVVNILQHKRVNHKFALVAGTGGLAKSARRNLYRRKSSNVEVKGYIHCKKNEQCLVEEGNVVGRLKDIHQYIRENPVDEIVIAIPIKPPKKVRKIIEAADYHGIRVKYVPDYEQLFGKYYKTKRYGNLEVINARQLPLDDTFYFFVKNTFDKLVALLALILLSPVFLSLMVWIKVDSKGPVFYCPTRIGRRGKPFQTYKFRSMQNSDTATGGLLSTQMDDPRITNIGRIMRKYSLDELPQLLNVLRGEMSIIGPRPHRSHLNQQLQESVEKYMVRHYFKPGITGWAQVNGWRGPTETVEQKTQRTQHDLWYMENWSLWLDIKIMYLTVFGKKVRNNAF